MAAIKTFKYGPMSITVDPDQAAPISATFTPATINGVTDAQLNAFILMAKAAQAYVAQVATAEANADSAINQIVATG